MSGTVRLKNLIEKAHIKRREFDCDDDLEAFGVSNTEGITRTAHRKSEDLGEYLVIEPGSFAYNPYRVNVGSIGLTPANVTGVVSPAYIVFRVKKQKLIPEVLLDFLKSSEGLRQINQLARGTVRKALRYEDLCEIEFPAISYERQLEILNHKRGFNKQYGSLLSEIAHQQAILAKLKQAILQEAIEGKLTADWRAAHPDVEPASQLLHRIQAEKARLIAAKKLRPEKPLPKITLAEIPFEIPKGWEWCRLKELGRWCGGGTPTKDVDRFWGDEVPWITPKDMKQPFLSDSQLKLTRIGVAESSAKLIPEKSILFVVRGMILAHTFPVSVNLVETTVNQDMKAIMPFQPGLEVFLRLLLQSSSQRILSVVTKSTHGTRKLETEVYENFVIPIPRLAEQAAIVERVEALMTTCRALEAEIEHARTHAAHLLQAVLKEAFAPASA
jgi:type I restriction enzyme S subunit